MKTLLAIVAIGLAIIAIVAVAIRMSGQSGQGGTGGGGDGTENEEITELADVQFSLQFDDPDAFWPSSRYYEASGIDEFIVPGDVVAVSEDLSMMAVEGSRVINGYHAATNSLEWQIVHPNKETDPHNSLVHCSDSTAGNTIFCSQETLPGILAIDMMTGDATTIAAAEPGAATYPRFLGEIPTGDKIFELKNLDLANFGGYDKILLAVTPEGDVRWRLELEKPASDGECMLVGSTIWCNDFTNSAFIDTESGQQTWVIEMPLARDPIVLCDRVILDTPEDTPGTLAHAYDFHGNRTVENLRRVKIQPLGRGDTLSPYPSRPCISVEEYTEFASNPHFNDVTEVYLGSDGRVLAATETGRPVFIDSGYEIGTFSFAMPIENSPALIINNGSRQGYKVVASDGTEVFSSVTDLSKARIANGIVTLHRLSEEARDESIVLIPSGS